jgi:hypothetical protein
MNLSILRKESLLASLVLLLATVPMLGQESQSQPGAQAAAAENSEALRKAALNPVASLISVPVQENWNFGIEPGDRIQNVLNIQPVIPVNLTKNWKLIVRWITPIVYQPVTVLQGSGPNVQTGYYGLGDMQPTFFLSPKVSKLIWGAGPQLVLPTATKKGILGQGKFAIGPSVVVVLQPGKYTLGILTNNVWSVAGNSSMPDVNQFLLQYFINYSLPKGWILTWQPAITADWNAPDNYRWVVPLGGGIGRIMRLGTQPVNIGLQFYGNALHPPGGSSWAMKMQIAFLFPTGAKKK